MRHIATGHPPVGHLVSGVGDIRQPVAAGPDLESIERQSLPHIGGVHEFEAPDVHSYGPVGRVRPAEQLFLGIPLWPGLCRTPKRADRFGFAPLLRAAAGNPLTNGLLRTYVRRSGFRTFKAADAETIPEVAPVDSITRVFQAPELVAATSEK